MLDSRCLCGSQREQARVTSERSAGTRVSRSTLAASLQPLPGELRRSWYALSRLQLLLHALARLPELDVSGCSPSFSRSSDQGKGALGQTRASADRAERATSTTRRCSADLADPVATPHDSSAALTSVRLDSRLSRAQCLASANAGSQRSASSGARCGTALSCGVSRRDVAHRGHVRARRTTRTASGPSPRRTPTARWTSRRGRRASPARRACVDPVLCPAFLRSD